MPSLETTPGQTWRIIDANLNRIGEGLRLLEDVARLLLDDAALTQQLKAMRHQLITGDLPFNQQLLQARDSEGDVGINIKAAEQKETREIPLMVVANSRRVQQSLRAIEELAKTPELSAKLDSDKFKQARFELYSIERKLLSRLLRQDKIKKISGLYAIIDTQALKGRRHIEIATEIIHGGAKIIQLRDKHSSKKELLPIAKQLQKLCAEHNILFMVNDYLDIALAADADGLHLGQEDLPTKEARKLLPIDKILGRSATTAEQAIAAAADGADYIATGSIFPSPTKEEAHVIGLQGLRQIREAVALPLVAIGGITEDNAAEVIAAGASSAAVISAILQAESPREAARQIADKLETSK
jgi:thiamine-phosphate pyrophosphorylase